MAPKKPATTAAPTKTRVDVPLGGLNVEQCPLPLWDDAEVEKEPWGDLSAAHVDSSQLYTDTELQSPIVAAFTTVSGLEWRRPSAVFSPFKPVVFRPTLQGNPYEFTLGGSTANAASTNAEDDDDDGPKPQSRAEMVNLHRSMKIFRCSGNEDEPSATGAQSTQSVRRAHSTAAAAKRRDKAIAPTPYFMKAFNSALMVINQAQELLPAGSYAWELIHPQAPGTHIPTYNPTGKYWVRLFIGGAFRRVVIDDRLPTDAFGQCVLTVTDSKEIWPALLAKALLKALGPHHEHLVFASPTFVVQTLMNGWVPQYVNPRRDEALAFKTVRLAIEKMKQFQEAQLALDATVTGSAAAAGAAGSAPPTPHGRPAGALVIATCNDTSNAAPAPAIAEEHAAATGLQCNQAFYLMDAKPHQNTTLLRLCSPGASWKGSYGYDTNAWTQELEAALGFNVAKDRDAADLARKWNDFWIPWDSFVKFFSTLVVLRDSSHKDFTYFKQITYSTDGSGSGADGAGSSANAAPAPAKAAAKDKAAAPANSTIGGAAAQGDTKPRSITKWVCFNYDRPSHALVAINGLPTKPQRTDDHPTPSSTPAQDGSSASPSPQAQPGDGNGRLLTTVTVHSYTWNNPDPFIQVLHLDAADGVTVSAPVLVPTGQRTYRITVSNLYSGVVVSIMNGCGEFSMGDQREICRDIMGIHTASDAGIYAEHVPDTPTIWFKRFFTVKQPATANFTVGTLPKGTDLTAHRQLPVETATGGKGGKPEKAAASKPPPKKGADAAPAEPPADLIDDGKHDHPITDFVRLSVIDLDTGKVTLDTVGKIMRMSLQPNKLGYIALARATTPEKYGRGYWRVTCTSDKPLEQFEPRNFEEVQSRTGVYTPNDADSLFRFQVIAAEPATTTIQLALKDGGDVPVTLSLFHNDKLIEQRESKGGAQIDHASLAPPDKAVPSTYAVQCTVNKAFIAQWEANRRESAIAAFRADTAEQTTRLMKRQKELAQLLAADPHAKLPAEDASAGAGGESQHASNVASLGFALSFHSSSAKLDIKEDASVNEAANAIKMSWSKKDEGAAAAAAPAKGAKPPAKGKDANPAADDANARFAKAKEARDRFLANREGVFMPYLHPATGKVILTPLEEEHLGYRHAPAAVPQPRDCSSRLHLGFTAGGANLHGGCASSSATTTTHSKPPAVKPAIKESVEKLQLELVPFVKEAKKQTFTEITEAMSAYFAEIKPVAVASEPTEDDKKRGGGAAKPVAGKK